MDELSRYNTVTIELLPEDADLTEAPNVIMEPKNPPYNLYGWKDGNTVSWDVEMADGRTQQLNFKVFPNGKSKDTLVGIHRYQFLRLPCCCLAA